MERKAKKKHHSRKNKASWRKNINLEDVENFLEDQRTEERVIGDVDHSQMFQLDVEPAEDKKLTRKQARREKAKEIPKSLRPLINTSKVQDPIIKRNRVKSKEERKHPLIKLKEESKAAEGVVPARVQQSRSDRKRYLLEKRNQKPKVGDFSKDIWDEEKIPREFKVEWYEPNLVNHNLMNLGTPVVKTPGEARKKRSLLKPLQVPHAGTSYNPTFDDHQELIEQVMAQEEKIIEREKHLERVTTKKFKKMSQTDIEIMKKKELIEGLPIDKNKKKQVKDEESEDEDYKTVNPPARNKKKDRKTRRKQLEARQRRALEEQQKLEVKKVKDIAKVPLLKQEIVKQTITVQKKQQNRVKKEREMKFQAGRIGKKRFREAEIAVNQLEDISGSMRSLKPEGNLLLDRFKSLQKRNILPTGALRKSRRNTRVKKYIKQSHKGEGIQTKNRIKPPKTSR